MLRFLLPDVPVQLVAADAVADHAEGMGSPRRMSECHSPLSPDLAGQNHLLDATTGVAEEPGDLSGVPDAWNS